MIIDQSDYYGQLILINCSHLTIANQNLSYTDIGLFGLYCNYLNITYNIITNNREGIGLWYSSSATITCNTITDNDWEGIHLEYSSSAIITCNTITDNKDEGICLEYSSSNATITCNTITNNGKGIFLRSSDYASITDNTIIDNNDDGIYLYSSSNATITCNTITNNNYDGIHLEGSANATIVMNLIMNNTEYGIYLYSSANANIYSNFFIDNNFQGSSQAYDSGQENIWYNNTTQIGNYWSDWNGIGSYPIDGYSNSVDLYPINDTDGDGIDDGEEVNTYHTNPLETDTDGEAERILGPALTTLKDWAEEYKLRLGN